MTTIDRWLSGHNIFGRAVSVLFAIVLLSLPGGDGFAMQPRERPVGSANRPHVIYILVDDLGWNDVGYHGSEIETPNIDRLVASGVRLNQFYVQPFCSPTRAALMTGRYPIRYGLQTEVIRPWADYGLPVEERLLAEVLDEAGYFTSISGKWHLGSADRKYLPRQRGFDHQYGHYIGALDYYSHRRLGALDWRRNGEVLQEEGYSTNLIADEVVRLIESRDTDQPMFLYVPFNAPHTPLQAPDSYIEQYQHLPDKSRRIYAAMVTCLDDAIGRIVEALEQRGMRDNTLIIFSSDNGGAEHTANNNPLRGDKGDVYGGGVRVPAFAVWPGELEAGVVIDEPLHIVDWYPTLAKLAGGSLEQPFPIDGKDIWPVLAEGQSSPHEAILLNSNQVHGARTAYPWAGLRAGDWKLVVDRWGDRERLELFNLAEDPYEEQDLSTQHPEKTEELFRRLREYEHEAKAPRLSAPPPAPSEAPEVWGPIE